MSSWLYWEQERRIHNQNNLVGAGNPACRLVHLVTTVNDMMELQCFEGGRDASPSSLELEKSVEETSGVTAGFRVGQGLNFLHSSVLNSHTGQNSTLVPIIVSNNGGNLYSISLLLMVFFSIAYQSGFFLRFSPCMCPFEEDEVLSDKSLVFVKQKPLLRRLSKLLS